MTEPFGHPQDPHLPDESLPFLISIEPHERAEAIDAYRSWLSYDQISEIEDAPETARICIKHNGTITSIEIEGA